MAPRLNSVSAVSIGLICGILLAGSGGASQGATTVPDLSGAWARLTFGFEQPKSGPGPIGRYLNKSNIGGNFNHPNLTPAGAQIVKDRGAMLRGGVDFPNPSLNCLPMISPYILRVQEFQLVQKKDEVVFLFMQDHQVRRVRLNAQHPANLTPSWYGDSIGHYEGDTLIVDTIGAKLGPFPNVDMFGSPYSDALHVTERYRLIPYEAAKAAQEKNIRDAGPVATEQAASVDENYKGSGLQVEFTVEDKNVFKQPWSASVTMRRAGGWVENVCAENAFEYYSNKITDIPTAAKPDF